uniref:Uncharacterized protein n=1 Tax=Nonomuraea gerenzanensis TaxID=93944 RepID=A0A1M4E5F4_9ACTN|nr:hypothetical protein BN4615_P3587 [Nonomuraea gerenzanensis]
MRPDDVGPAADEGLGIAFDRETLSVRSTHLHVVAFREGENGHTEMGLCLRGRCVRAGHLVRHLQDRSEYLTLIDRRSRSFSSRSERERSRKEPNIGRFNQTVSAAHRSSCGTVEWRTCRASSHRAQSPVTCRRPGSRVGATAAAGSPPSAGRRWASAWASACATSWRPSGRSSRRTVILVDTVPAGALLWSALA